MINLENFNENFKSLGNDLVVQLIDMFAEVHQEDMNMIRQNINSKDFLSLRFNAHHLKGSIAYFMDPETTELTQKLEEMGEMNSDEGLTKTFTELQSAIKSLLLELAVYRNQIIASKTLPS